MQKTLFVFMWIIGFAWTCVWADESQQSLLSQGEYGKNLYENPRGIACTKCHGKDGEEKIIARYKHKGEERVLVAPRINHLDFGVFAKALHAQNGVMPHYYLTNEEIQAIYMYLYRP